MSCPRASAAFATSAFSPTLAASRSSPGYAPHWPFPNPSGPPSPRITANAAHSSPATASTFALSAAAEWSTSAHGRIALRHGRPHAATPHDAQPANHASLVGSRSTWGRSMTAPGKTCRLSPRRRVCHPMRPKKSSPSRPTWRLRPTKPHSRSQSRRARQPEKRVPHSPPRRTPIGGGQRRRSFVQSGFKQVPHRPTRRPFASRDLFEPLGIPIGSRPPIPI